MSGGKAPRRVLLTRDPARAGAWLQAFAAAGLEAEARSPTQQRLLPEAPALVKRLLRPPRFTWTVFTSAVAAQGVLGQLEALDPKDRARACEALGRLAAVGPGTAAPLEAAGMRADLVAAPARASALMASLVPRLDPSRDRVLWPRGAQALPTVGEALGRRGVAWEAWDVYETLPSPHAPALVEDLIRGRYEAVVFSAPSALEALVETAGARREALERALSAIRRIALGPSTARALERRGLPAHAEVEAARPEAVVRAVRDALG